MPAKICSILGGGKEEDEEEEWAPAGKDETLGSGLSLYWEIKILSWEICITLVKMHATAFAILG